MTLLFKKIKEIELDKYKHNIDEKRIQDYLLSISGGNIDDLKKNFKDNNINFDLFLEEEYKPNLNGNNLY